LNEEWIKSLTGSAYSRAKDRLAQLVTQFYFQWRFTEIAKSIVEEELRKSDSGVKIKSDTIIEEAAQLFVRDELGAFSTGLISMRHVQFGFSFLFICLGSYWYYKKSRQFVAAIKLIFSIK